MAETSLSLLHRLQKDGAAADWSRLVDLYTPLIQGWLKRHGLTGPDADDLLQDVLSVLIRELPAFVHQERRGAFRAWLKTITVNRACGFWRQRNAHAQPAGAADFGQVLDELEDPNSRPSLIWNEEHDRHVMSRLLAAIEPEFNAVHWQAFRRQVFDGLPASQVAAELGVTDNVVLLAKSRILRRLRQEASGLLD
ncbi:MAG: RNA polymerase sigma factor [Gemmataceae bacterium]